MAMAVPILMYHYLGIPSTAEDRPYYVSHDTFRGQLNLLRAEGYTTIDLTNLADHLDGGAALPERPVILTFDDGHVSFFEMAIASLARTGFTATLFAITGRVGNPGHCNWGQLRELEMAGHRVGSHTHTHPILTRLDNATITDELVCSRELLAAELSHPVDILAYRGGHYDDRVVNLARAAGYRCAVTTRPGLNSSDANLLTLRRYAIREEDKGECFLAKLRPKQSPSLVRRLLRHFVAK